MKLRTVLEAMRAEKTGKWAITHRGELVRSASERRIANFLYHNRIDYQYERQLRTFRVFGRRIAKPDFYLPRYKLYIEYWGLIDAEDESVRRRYNDNMQLKLAEYNALKIRFVGLVPEDLRNLRQALTRKFARAMGFAPPMFRDY